MSEDYLVKHPLLKGMRGSVQVIFGILIYMDFKTMSDKFGMLTAINFSHSKIGRPSDQFWVFQCDCGKIKVCRLFDVKKGKIQSCGCLHKSQLSQRNKANAKHGFFGTPTYNVWSGIIDRCNNSNSSNYKTYGAKGIKVCERWQNSFESFLEDMGIKPLDCSIDRINVNGNYEPDNCRWADAKTQARNRTNNVRYEFDSKNLTLSEWSEITGIKSDTLQKRIKKQGWTIEEALTRKVK
jgi:hypothetical protein